MPFSRLPRRDPRTVARDIPGVLDVLFPRLTGGLVRSLNKESFSFSDIEAVSDELIGKSRLQKAMLFELSMARAESLLRGEAPSDWDECLRIASSRQKQHYDAKIPDKLSRYDIEVADHAASNLIVMLKSIQMQCPNLPLEHGPLIPGLGWIASGRGDFAIGSMLIEVKHTEENFRSGDFRQVLMYWLLKYAKSVEDNDSIWSEILLLNPRRNSALRIKYEYLIRSASAGLNRIELVELLRSAAVQEVARR
ncbi:hypothetical protein [Methylobacterium sp. E-066]|uniref:hypothetical protein n=1 Tax=Methylobacterium sp. E-066 TaxID=2836584 RepID=UPI001FBA3D23|nr:hypothetical protein [Methylobacterium sp. E-066]MCJ2141250.1 hypothetical protein [Methylobacterium sp. E-066]